MRSAMLPQAAMDLLNRRPVWAALSELFLDTELQDHDFDSLARTLTDSPYALEELDAILFDEVLPILWPNTAVAAGVWDAFDPHWLEEQILKRAARTLRVPSRLLPRSPIRDDWERLRVAVAELHVGRSGA